MQLLHSGDGFVAHKEQGENEQERESVRDSVLVMEAVPDVIQQFVVKAYI